MGGRAGGGARGGRGMGGGRQSTVTNGLRTMGYSAKEAKEIYAKYSSYSTVAGQPVEKQAGAMDFFYQGALRRKQIQEQLKSGDYTQDWSGRIVKKK